jgi:hypothetical protein
MTPSVAGIGAGNGLLVDRPSAADAISMAGQDVT